MVIQENPFSNNNETDALEIMIAIVAEKKQRIGDNNLDARKERKR